MHDRRPSDQAGQAVPSHQSYVLIAEEADDCRALIFRHISDAQRLRILRAAHSARVPLPASLTAEMYRQGEIRRGGGTSRYRPAQQRELAQRACALQQMWGSWAAAATHMGNSISGPTLWRWHDRLKKCANCETR